MHNFATKLLIVLGCFVVLFCKLTLAVQKVSGSSLIDLPLPASEYESLRHGIYMFDTLNQFTFLTKIQNRINKKSEKEILLLPTFCMVIKILGW